MIEQKLLIMKDRITKETKCPCFLCYPRMGIPNLTEFSVINIIAVSIDKRVKVGISYFSKCRFLGKNTTQIYHEKLKLYEKIEERSL